VRRTRGGAPHRRLTARAHDRAVAELDAVNSDLTIETILVTWDHDLSTAATREGLAVAPAF